MNAHPQARFIVETLVSQGFVAYYAGGFVRDLLLKYPSDDIDIATNAPSERIQALFPRTVPIGINFGIILVIVEDQKYEVATFRQDMDYKDGRHPSGVTFSTALEDAKRRDFTVNGMFYDPLEENVIDFVGGKKDLENKLIRAIGDPHERIKEDRLRMIRAVRLSCRLGFSIDPETIRAIIAHAKELFPSVAMERIWQEFKKGHAFNTLGEMIIRLHELTLLGSIFPSLAGIPLEEIKRRVAPIKKYPKTVPVIASFLPLFPHYSLSEARELCTHLKLPKADQLFISFFDHFKSLDETSSLFDWAHAYANPFAASSIAILQEQGHDQRQILLKESIRRIKENDPVITSSHLLRHGIQPGKEMGILLNKAEQIAINEQITDPNAILGKILSK